MDGNRKMQSINREKIAYWFFRLNGFLTIENFLIHHEQRTRGNATELDLIGVRFPWRRELAMSGTRMQDYKIFEKSEKKIDLIITEVKTGKCDLNGPWTNEHSQHNMRRILFALGATQDDAIDKAATGLSMEKYYEDDQYRFQIIAVGKHQNPSLPEKVTQITWQEIYAFIYCRLNEYRRHKASHSQWDQTGKMLYELANQYDDFEAFQEALNKTLI